VKEYIQIGRGKKKTLGGTLRKYASKEGTRRAKSHAHQRGLRVSAAESIDNVGKDVQQTKRITGDGEGYSDEQYL